MKLSKNAIQDRRDRLLALVRRGGSYNPETYATELGCSVATVRRDLVFLSEMQLISKRYGNVAAAPAPSTGTAAPTDEISLLKHQIAGYAATLIEDGDVVFINTSKTALSILPYITAKGVTVITNSAVAVSLQIPDGISVILTGGELRHPKASMVGDYAVRNLMGMVATKSFIGCTALSVENGASTANANEVAINKLMLERVTKQAYILADHTKLGKTSSFTTCPIESIPVVITDTGASEEILSRFEQHGVTVLVP